MPDRSRKKRPADTNRRAWQIVQQVVAEKAKDEDAALVQKALEEGKNPAAVLLGRKGGKKGGRARAETLTPEQRSEIARAAATARWEKKGEED